MDARHAGAAGGGRVLGLGDHLGRKSRGVLLQDLAQFRNEHLGDEFAAVDQAVLVGDEDQLDRLELFRNRHGDAVGVDPIGLAVAIEPERRNDRHNALGQQRIQEFGVDAFDLAGEEMVHALEDADGMGDDHVRVGGAQVVGRQPLEDLVRQAVGGGQGQIERGRIGDAGAVQVRCLDLPAVGQRPDLRGRAVDEHHADVQGPEERHVQHQRGEVVVGDDGAVNREDEGLFAELRDVLQDAPEIGQFHGSATCGGNFSVVRHQFLRRLTSILSRVPRVK